MANVLVVGSGAREAAIGVKFLASPQVDAVFVAPGNDGMTLLGLTPIAIDVMDFAGLIDFARANVDLTFVGPEQPLVAGIVDAFVAAGQPIFGANRDLARLEGSKTFAKQLMQRHQLPTARAEHVASLAAAEKVLAQWGAPLVVKADGLAAGKGVVVAQTVAAARAALQQLYGQDEHAPVLLEEFLSGQEASVMAFFAGTQLVILPLSQDHKPRFNGDHGPNTGGMGAISPARQFDARQTQAARELLTRTVTALTDEGMRGCGVIYMGLMFTAAGPKILEYNMRLGDPETQVLLPQVENDFYTLIQDLLAGKQTELRLNGNTYVGVVLSHPAYPAASRPALPVAVPTEQMLANHCWLPAAVHNEAGQLFSAGGRVLTLVAAGPTPGAARNVVYALVRQYAGELAYRDDIGVRSLASG